MIPFRPITLADKERIERYTLRSKAQNCDLSFANIFAWQPLYRSVWAEVNNSLVIRFSIDGGDRVGYMQPISEDGSVEFESLIPLLALDAERCGDRLRIIGITEEGREAIEKIYGGEFALYTDPDYEDYIYLRESLSTLSGKRLQPKRNHINQFLKRYESLGYTYRPLCTDDFEACMALDRAWRTEHNDANAEELRAMERSFAHFDELGLRGGVLYVDEELAAFTYGSAINAETFCIHIEKGRPDVTGCYTVINKLFAESLPEEYIYINREEDLGIEGLRRSKQSYYPHHREAKYLASYLHRSEAECRRLWCEVFGDEELFVDDFLTNHYSESGMLRIESHEGEIHSMLHIISFESEMGRVAYIYGVATAESSRRKGYATQLLNDALKRIADKGYSCAVLIPSEESLKGYYAQFGFEECGLLRFESRFDFGSGDSTKDFGMVWWCDVDYSRCTHSIPTLFKRSTPSVEVY